MTTSSAPATQKQGTTATKPAARPGTKAPAKVAASKPAAAAPAKAVRKATSNAAATPQAKKAAPPVKVEKVAKAKKAKLIRDSFTMPEPEYDLIATVKKRCLAKGLGVKKSEVLRAAVASFAAQTDTAVLAALQALVVIKTGRPPKGQKQG